MTGFNKTTATVACTGSTIGARTQNTVVISSQSHCLRQIYQFVYFAEEISGAIANEMERYCLKHKRIAHHSEFKRRQSNVASFTTTNTASTIVTCKQLHRMDFPFSTSGDTSTEPGFSNGTFIVRSGTGSSRDTIDNFGSESVERFSSRNLTSDENVGKFSNDCFVRCRFGAQNLTDDRDPTINDATRRRQNLLQPPAHSAGCK